MHPLSCDLLLSHSILHTLACDLLQYNPLLATPLYTDLATSHTSITFASNFLLHISAQLKAKGRSRRRRIDQSMKGSAWLAVLVIIEIIFLPSVMSVRHIGRQHSHHGHHHSLPPKTKDGILVTKAKFYWERLPVMKRKGAETLQIAGSSLPDCSHACGSCSPCRLVMVSFVCASLEQAETCPMAYKCMCNNKAFPVP